MYEAELRTQISQGDIFEDVPIAYVMYLQGNQPPFVDVRRVRAVMLIHDCEYDKAVNQWVIMAEVRPLSEIRDDHRGNIKGYKVLKTFYLEAIPDLLPDSYIDFRRIDRLQKQLLSPDANRTASLNDTARQALQRQVALFFGHGRTRP